MDWCGLWLGIGEVGCSWFWLEFLVVNRFCCVLVQESVAGYGWVWLDVSLCVLVCFGVFWCG